METVSVERAAADDADQFADWEREPSTQQFILPYSANEHRRKMTDPNLVYLRILDDGILAGFFILSLDPDRHSTEFRRVVVPEKNRGIGQAAIAAMEQFCRNRLQRNRLWLDVFEDNYRGRHIYEKLGYKSFGQTDHNGRTLLLYEKRI